MSEEVLVSVSRAQLGALLRAAQKHRADYARILKPGLSRSVARGANEEIQLLMSCEQLLEEARERSHAIEAELERELGPLPPRTATTAPDAPPLPSVHVEDDEHHGNDDAPYVRGA